MNLRELVKIGKNNKIRYYGCKSKHQLCEELNMKYEPADTSFLKNIRKNPTGLTLIDKTGNVTKFKSIYAASKFLDKNPGSIYHCLKTQNMILKTKIGTYRLSLNY